MEIIYSKYTINDFFDDAIADITATKDCFFELKKAGIIK